jgi:GGDEF domain-containing protein
VDATSDITTADLALGEVGRDLWEPALPHLTRLFSGDATAYLDAFESAACGAGLTQEVPVKALLDAYSEGAARVRARILAGGDADAETAARRLLAVELRRAAAEASPVDDDTGAIKPDELDERLSLEVERCMRMDLSLGLLELALDEGGDEPAPSATVDRGAVALHEIGGCLRENLRRYDSVGLTQDGAFLLVLPDISRRGLAGAAERLRRELGGCAGRGRPPDFTFALAHYDFVDVNANEMLTGLTRSMQEALSSHRPLAWV